ncbi:DNA-binding transcriptional LysR family regulator [Bradyrhizobium sp. R2.2-H]|jgi:DNA-binding transcriptional LysR family regulator|uniref:LysR family transcriptional regulator n=1 Tax=unclassified Bradyrhizobium TaxID=2631580 RepID=UPI00104F8602|nr:MULTISPECIES: LysR family transcriptional regulator [unclassified Bradyrhizobium]TCU72553.1 DNA-binding transcriptional LysR family regulator [Bradyrhizobium sp. Y-H1]TCU74674.1 DNA-binding transcriptional LysR family regulator [Bradyrhizobium sp. R2.2-H]
MQWADRIGRRLKLRDLQILLTVVERGSMAKAAAELAISQPAVSKAITDLEHTFGIRLLERGRGGIEPTAYGRALVARGQVILDELRQGVDEIAFLADPSVGELHIGSTESIAAGLLPAVIERFSREQPRVHLNVAQAVISKLHYRELRERSIDLMLGRIPTPFKESDLKAEVVYDDQVVVVAGRQSKWARLRRLKLADLIGERWILPPADTMHGSLTAELFRASSTELPRRPITTLSMHLCCRLVANTQFVTMLPASILRYGNHDRSLKILPVQLPAQPRPVAILTLKSRALSPAAKLFIECVRQTAKLESKGKMP